jgi:hypothetical protein
MCFAGEQGLRELFNGMGLVVDLGSAPFDFYQPTAVLAEIRIDGWRNSAFFSLFRFLINASAWV